jgi:hypothetical protein
MQHQMKCNRFFYEQIWKEPVIAYNFAMQAADWKKPVGI